MAKIYSVNMNKGGVGKTSLVTNLASALSVSRPDKRILIIDTDGQGNCSIAYGLKPQEFEHSIYHIFLGEKSIDDVKISVSLNVDLVPANDDMNFLEFDILTQIQKYPKPFELLKAAVDQVKEDYDYIFIDTPPSLGLVAGNVLAVTDNVVIPFVPEMFGVQGLIRVVEAIEDFKGKTNPNLEISGVVGMMVDQRTTLHSEMIQNARKYCLSKGFNMYDTVISKSIRFANATAYEGKPAVLSSDKSNKIVKDYFNLLDEVMSNVKA